MIKVSKIRIHVKNAELCFEDAEQLDDLRYQIRNAFGLHDGSTVEFDYTQPDEDNQQ